MSTRIGKHLRSNAIAYVALFFALTGTAFAVKSNSIKSKHIKDGEVRSEDVADDSGPDALTGVDIAPNSLSTADIDDSSLFGDNTLNGADIDEGSLYNDNSLDGADVSSLTGADIDESTLSGVNADSVDSQSLCPGNLPMALGESRAVCQQGPLSVQATCSNVSGNVVGLVALQTSADDAFYGVLDAAGDTTDADFDDAESHLVAAATDIAVDTTGVVTPLATIYMGRGSDTIVGTVGARMTKTSPIGSSSCAIVSGLIH